MKPDLDLKDDRVKAMIEALRIRGAQALDSSRRIENAVLPFYCEVRGRIRQSGSCVAFRAGDEYFLLSAAHVIESIGGNMLLLPNLFGEKLRHFKGERFSTLPGPSGTHEDDPVDAAVYHFLDEVPQLVQDNAITVADMAFDVPSEASPHWVCGIAGFHAKKEKRIGMISDVRRELLLSLEYKAIDYVKNNVDPFHHIITAFEREILMGTSWKRSLTPRGFSGGAIIEFQGIPVSPFVDEWEKAVPRLAGIFTEHRPEKRGAPGSGVGTRPFVHFGLIEKFLPEVVCWKPGQGRTFVP